MRFKRRITGTLVAMTVVFTWTASLLAMAPEDAPRLPDPTGNVVRVTTEAELQNAVRSLASGTTIVIAAGTYDLTIPVHVRNVNDVTLRGETGDYDDVVLRGLGMSDYHPITLQPGTEAPHIYHVRLVNAGEQFIKGNTDGVKGVDSGIVEYSVMEYDTVARSYYTNGVDILRGEDWIVRHNRFRNIRSEDGRLAGPAILFWQQSRNPLVEGNTIINCAWGIAFGLGRDDNDNIGGIIRNNCIYRDADVAGDTGILAWKSPDTKILNNTVFQNGTHSSSIEYRFANSTGIVIRNNLTDSAVLMRENATALVESNVTTADGSWFDTPETGVLRLEESAVQAIDSGLSDSDVGFDWDGTPRPVGSAYDIGADEHLRPAAGDFDGSGHIDFKDFLFFVSAYGSREGKPDWNPAYDLNGDGVIGFIDFLIFVQVFGSNS